MIWEKTQAIKVPASALFRENGQWAVFVVNQGKAQLRQVSIEKNNGTEASVLKGLQVDERVILYPTAVLSDGLAVVSVRHGVKNYFLALFNRCCYSQAILYH